MGNLSKAFIRKKQDGIFHRKSEEIPGIQRARLLCLSGIDPVGRFVTGAPEALFLNKGFKRNGSVNAALLPVTSQLF